MFFIYAKIACLTVVIVASAVALMEVGYSAGNRYRRQYLSNRGNR
jgi:hypothetical protein